MLDRYDIKYCIMWHMYDVGAPTYCGVCDPNIMCWSVLSAGRNQYIYNTDDLTHVIMLYFIILLNN